MSIGTRAGSPARGLFALALVATLVAACLWVVLAGAGPRLADAAQVTQIGATKKTPKPDCPKSPCLVEGHVTGIQTGASGGKSAYRVPKDGTIVAWSLALSRPNQKQRKSFGNILKTNGIGSDPTARVAVLKKKGKSTSYKLRRQTPMENLTNVLGTTPIYTLKSPLKVKAGDMVGLSIPTWAPAFASNISNSNEWRGSRSKGKCVKTDDIQKGSAQTKQGSTRHYDCSYTGARLLYWAYFVKS